MKALLFWTLALASIGTPPPTQTVVLRFRPAPGSQLRLDYERVFSLELGDTNNTLTYDGEEQSAPEVAQMGYTMTETESIVYSDTYHGKGSALLGIERHFEEIGNTLLEQVTDPTGEEYEDLNEGQSDLEGATVQFSRSSEKDEFEVKFAESSAELEPELLEGLEARADLAGFLPSEEVSPGDSWDVPLAAFIGMTNLSGDLSVVQEGEDPDQPDDGYGEQFDANLTGRFTAELVELVEEQGLSLAVIRLHAELETTVETNTELDAEGALGSEQELHHFEFELQGFLRWDVDGAHARQLHLEGPITLETEADKAYTFQGHELVMHETQAFSGSLDFAASVD